MNEATALLRITGDDASEPRGVDQHTGGPRRRGTPQGSASVGLWVFMGVASSLFALFITAYVMRMSEADAVRLALPAQVWLSTALLLAGSLLLQVSAGSARGAKLAPARALLLAGGLCALAFLGSQLWAWAALHAAQVLPSGNPAGSFFYLLSAMHGLHVLGGLVGWGYAMRGARNADTAWRIALCARYWHFLLAVWLALFAALGWLTPEVARAICGRT